MGDIWFRRKRYGWGWQPVTWQGWAVIGAWFATIVALAVSAEGVQDPKEVLLRFILPVSLLTVALIKVCYLKGEPPRWQWGDRNHDSNES